LLPLFIPNPHDSFYQGTSAPEANIDIKANSPVNARTPASLKIEHLGGDSIHFESSDLTRVTASLNGGYPSCVYSCGIGNFSIGNETILYLTSDGSKDVSKSIFGKRPVSGDTINIKIIDLNSNQLISNRDVRF